MHRTYASKYIPIIASVSEHQPPTWPSYFMDINVLAFLVPAGIIVSILKNFTKIYMLLLICFLCIMNAERKLCLRQYHRHGLKSRYQFLLSISSISAMLAPILAYIIWLIIVSDTSKPDTILPIFTGVNRYLKPRSQVVGKCVISSMFYKLSID